jgi:hypothetical protein
VEPELFNRIALTPTQIQTQTQEEDEAGEETALSQSQLELLSQALVQQLLDPALQKATLAGLKAQLLLFEGQYLLHYREESVAGTGVTAKAEKFKFISPEAVRLAFSNSPLDSGWLGTGIYRWGAVREGNWLVKFIPPKADYRLELRLPQTTGQPTPELSLLVEVALPGLIFVGLGQTYYLWTIKETEFSPQAHLYAAPLPNLYPDGKICWGQNRPPPVSAQTIETAWQLFISSEFTDHLVQGKSKSFSQDVRLQLLALAKDTPVQKSEKGAAAATGTTSKRPKRRRKGYPLEDLVAYTEGWGTAATPATVTRAVDQLIARHS